MDPKEAIGVLSCSTGGKALPVFSGDKQGPNLAILPFGEVKFFVLAHTVFSKQMVLRQVRTSEVMSVWDYEGKLESRGWSHKQELKILKAWLTLPPAKMLRCFYQAACEAILLKFEDGVSPVGFEKSSHGQVGCTTDIPFTPLEDKATTRIAAAQADDAEVDLSAWSHPGETPVEAKARETLRRFAVRWWSMNLRREAMYWWNRSGKDPQNLAAIHNCIFRAQACSYWNWHRGSRLFFWRFPPEY
jgi:hypothetical protein